MNREQRRELTKRKWLSRTKKVYKSCGTFYVPIKGIKANQSHPIYRSCESITDFLDNSIYAKILRNCTVPYRSKMMQFEYKKENRKIRKSSKKQIEEDLQEIDDEQEESDDLQDFENDQQRYLEKLLYLSYLYNNRPIIKYS